MSPLPDSISLSVVILQKGRHTTGANNMYLIRKAERTDCAAMLDLVHELAVFEKAPQEVTVTLSHFEESGFGTKPVWWAWVAEHEGRIIGMALYYIRFSTWKGQRMYLEDIIVNEVHRGRGAGTLLMDALIADAREKQFSGITWQVLEWNEPAIRFYEKYQASFDPEWVNVALQLR
jgi:GNAT superfamily N-acetyltransferase